ncbi:TPA: hypothetical protein ACH3X1_009434 [Trebouxia sp. C0004]
MSQTASAAGCPAPLPSELHPAPSFSADSLQLPGFAQAVTVTPEAQLSPELSQASSDSLETQIACLQVGAEANVVAQACVRSPELPIQAKSAFAQAAAATVWYEPPALTTAHAVTSLDPTVTTSNQPGPNMPAVTALASQPGSHQGMNPQQGWGHESVDPTLQAQSGSDGSRLAHHEDSSCQSHEPWQNVHGNAWAVDQSGGFSTAAQTDQTMLSDMPQQDSSSWDYYEISKAQQLLDQLDYDDSWQDENSLRMLMMMTSSLVTSSCTCIMTAGKMMTGNHSVSMAAAVSTIKARHQALAWILYLPTKPATAWQRR